MEWISNFTLYIWMQFLIHVGIEINLCLHIMCIYTWITDVHIYIYIYTGDPLHSRALAHSRAPLFTQPCPHCSHSRAPGEQWAGLCVFTLQGCVQAARLCRGSSVIYASPGLIIVLMTSRSLPCWCKMKLWCLSFCSSLRRYWMILDFHLTHLLTYRYLCCTNALTDRYWSVAYSYVTCRRC